MVVPPTRLRLVLAAAIGLSACADCPEPFDGAVGGALEPGRRLLLETADGELRVTGRERQPDVTVRVRGCAGGAVAMDTTAGGAIHVRVEAADADVDVLVPAGAPVAIRHGAGDVAVRGTGGVRLDTRAGRVTVDGVLGDAAIDAGSGRLTVGGVMGEVLISHGGGPMEVRDVSAGVRIRDGAGGIRVRDVQETVVIESDGSGEIDARDIGGDLVVRRKTDDARLIRYSGVTGNVSLPSDLLPP